eukprot:Rhum_TRINITY_DN7964_c0_g2::Rhum_TRINITY_DN7964_c0_g2_i1::g.25435::m.25435
MRAASRSQHRGPRAPASPHAPARTPAAAHRSASTAAAASASRRASSGRRCVRRCAAARTPSGTCATRASRCAAASPRTRSCAASSLLRSCARLRRAPTANDGPPRHPSRPPCSTAAGRHAPVARQRRRTPHLGCFAPSSRTAALLCGTTGRNIRGAVSGDAGEPRGRGGRLQWSMADGKGDAEDRRWLSGRGGAVRMTEATTTRHMIEFAATLRHNDSHAWRKYLKEYERLRSAGHTFGPTTLAEMLTRLQRWKRSGELRREFSRARAETPEHVDLGVVNVMLHAYAFHRDAAAQKDLLMFLCEQNIEPDIYSFTALVKCQGLRGSYDDALDCYKEALRRGVVPDAVFICTTLAHLPPAYNATLLRELSAHGMPPVASDPLLASSLIKSATVAPADVPLAERRFAACTERTGHVYRSLLWCYVTARCVAKATSLLDAASDAAVAMPRGSDTVVVEAMVSELEEALPALPQATPAEVQAHREKGTRYIAIAERIYGCLASGRAPPPKLSFVQSRALCYLAAAAQDEAAARRRLGAHALWGYHVTRRMHEALAANVPGAVASEQPRPFHCNQNTEVWDIRSASERRQSALPRPRRSRSNVKFKTHPDHGRPPSGGRSSRPSTSGGLMMPQQRGKRG